jgi:hypothetical protein
MPIDPPVILAIAVVALYVASTVAQRAGAYADQKAGRHRVAQADRRGAIGPLLDLADRSVAAYTLRTRLGLSTLTREERRAADQRAAAVARAEEIRQARFAPTPHLAPKRLVVAGAGGSGSGGASSGRVGFGRALAPARSTLSVELLAAGLGLAVVIGVVIGIWPRERGGVLSATGVPTVVPALASPAVGTPAPSESPSLTPAPGG